MSPLAEEPRGCSVELASLTQETSLPAHDGSCHNSAGAGGKYPPVYYSLIQRDRMSAVSVTWRIIGFYHLLAYSQSNIRDNKEDKEKKRQEDAMSKIKINHHCLMGTKITAFI